MDRAAAAAAAAATALTKNSMMLCDAFLFVFSRLRGCSSNCSVCVIFLSLSWYHFVLKRMLGLFDRQLAVDKTAGVPPFQQAGPALFWFSCHCASSVWHSILMRARVAALARDQHSVCSSH